MSANTIEAVKIIVEALAGVAALYILSTIVRRL